MPSLHNPNIETELLLIVESWALRSSLIWKALVVLLDAGAENEKVEFSDWGWLEPPAGRLWGPRVPLPLMQWMVAPGSKAASRQMVLEGRGGFCKVRAGPNMSKCQQPWEVKIYLCPPHSQECVSYLVGDISVLLAFKIQIQGAWVIVSLQKCENKEQKDNYFMGFFLTLLKKR